MEQHFSSHTLAEIFRDLYLGERSGVLELSREGVAKRIYFDRGMILFADSDLEEEDLGPRLVQEGKISSGALAEARRNIAEARDLPQALINRGLIGKRALSHTVRFLVDRVVQSVFRWEGGTARFNEGWLLQEIFEADILSTFETILRGIAALKEFDPIRVAMKGLDNRIRVREPAPVPLERLALSPAHGFILSRADGTTTVPDVLSILPPAEEDLACRFLYGLLVMGAMEYDPPVCEGPFRIAAILRDHADQVALERSQEKQIQEAYKALHNKNPWELLNVSAMAGPREIERAYEDAKAPFRRERLMPRIREQMRSELAVIEGRLLEAYLSLTQAHPEERRPEEPGSTVADREGTLSADDLLVRVEMDKTRTKMAMEENARVADSYYQKARRFVREGDFHNAIQYAKLAISYKDDEARFYYLLADCQVRNPEARWQRMAEQNYQRAVDLDPWNPEYLVSLGQFYRKRGLKLRARKQFQKALKVAPGHEHATRELAALR